MSDFFDSEIVKEELQEIRDLQNDIYGKIMKLHMFDRDEKVEHIDLLAELLEKQKVMYTRLSLSDDPEAVKMKEQLHKTIPLMGFPRGTDMNLLFDGMSETISKLKDNIDKS